MKAAVLTAIDSPLELLDVDPGDLDYGQVLVRVLCSGICGAQLAEIRGHKGNAGHIPHLLGHEGCGTVEAVGVGVTRVKPGDKVVMHWRKAAGIESPLPRYRIRGEWRTSGRVTTFSEKAICSENRVTPIPADTPRELAALLGCGLSTALGTLERDAALKMGESLMVIGCGGLGINLLRAAHMAHASPVVAVDVRESKRDIAESFGAEFVHTSSDFLAEASCKCGFDVVVDTSGDSVAISRGLRCVAPGGRFVMVGQPKPGASVLIEDAAHLFGGEGKSIRATQGGGFRPERDIPRYLRLWKSGALKLDGIITHRVPLAEINRGLDLVRAGEASRVLVEMR